MRNRIADKDQIDISLLDFFNYWPDGAVSTTHPAAAAALRPNLSRVYFVRIDFLYSLFFTSAEDD